MRKVSSYKCPECGMRYKSLGAWGEHLERIHPGSIPEGYSYARYFYFCTTGKTAGSCVQCHRPTEWNEATGKYSRYCNDPKCKQEYVKTAKKRMVDKYGKAHLLNDPNKQREMLDSRSQSYKFRDGGTVRYLSSYEKDFLMTAEYTLGLKSKDIIGPSPNTYVYIYEGKEHFYIPDFYIPDLNLEIEIKDGGDDPNKHPHMQVDRAKEKLKDEMMIKNPAVNYFKIIDKKYTDFYKFILDCKLAIDDTTRDKLSQLLIATEGAIDFAFEGIVSRYEFTEPETILNYVRKNVTYAEFSKLQSPQETLKKHKGSCHDQVLLSFMLLEELKIKPTIHFFISYKEGEEAGGDTHTFITYEEKNQVCWFETAWGDMEGIHKYPNMKALKEDIKAHHDKTPMGKKYPELEFAVVPRSKLEYGMSLDELVQACLGSEASESVLFSGKDEYFNIDKWQKSKHHNILYITGHSGSGKSTLGQELANKYGATFIELDRVVQGEPSVGKWDPDKNLESDRIISMIYGHDELMFTEDETDSSVGIKRKRAMDLLYNYCTKHTNTLYIWEGIWLYEAFSKEYFSNKPLIIKGTSRETSMHREIIRDEFNFNITQKANHRAFYKSAEIKLNTLRNYMRQNAEASPALESAKCDIPTVIPVQIYEKDLKAIPKNSALYEATKNFIEASSKNRAWADSLENYGFYDENKNLMAVMTFCDHADGTRCVDELIVDTPYRRRGLATYMLDFAFKQMNATWLAVSYNNDAARKLYTKYGLVENLHENGWIIMVHPSRLKKISFKSLQEVRIEKGSDLPREFRMRYGDPELSRDVIVIAYKYHNAVTHVLNIYGKEMGLVTYDKSVVSDVRKDILVRGFELGAQKLQDKFMKDTELSAYYKALHHHLTTGEYVEPATEQGHFDILVDKLDPNHKQKGKKSLSQFKRQPLTKELVKKFKGQGKLITDGFRYQDPKHPEDTCVVWTDGDKFVGAIAYDTYPDKQGYKWITALDVGYDYKSYGLGEQIVKYAMSQGANALAVQYDNEIALRLYKKLGFKTSKISEEDVKAGRNASYNLYLDPSHAVESALKASERTDFGLPDIKKYPMPDEKHVLLAIQYFNYVEEDRERELADNILKRMSELNIKCVNVGEKNRFAKYYKPTEDSVMTSWCASEPGMGIVAMESGHGDDFYTPIRLNTKQWCNYKGQKYYPLYIVLLKNMDALGRVIQTYTKEPYSHSLISFDPSMNDLYTFGHKLMKKGDKEHMDFGTAHETFNPKTGRFHYPLNTQYEIFVMFFNEKQIKAVRKTIDDIFTNHEKYKYNIAGLIQYIFKIPRTNPQKLFCSQFVSMVLNSGKPDLLDRDPSMYTPSNLMTLRGIFSVDSGVMKDYDATLVEKKTKQIFDRIVDSGDTTALEHTNLLYNVDWENSDSIEVYGGYTYPES